VGIGGPALSLSCNAADVLHPAVHFGVFARSYLG
jgi:hypothetical protein